MSRARAEIVEALCAAGRRLDALGLVPARDGNLSARVAADRVLVTGTGVRKRNLVPADLVEVDLAGRVLDDGRATTELGMHLAIYRLRPDVNGIVHAHPPVAVGFASSGLGLTECLMPEVAVTLGAVPLTRYATPGTPELEEAVAETAREYDAFLLANHGAVTLGSSIDEALDRMETLEHFARIALVTRLLGGPKPLTPEAVAALRAARLRAGDARPITCEPAGGAISPEPAGVESPASPPLPGLESAELARVIADALAAALRRPG